MIGIDTNVLVRYFAEDDPEQTPLAIRFVERTLTPATPGYVSLVTLAELIWVLRTRYAASPTELRRALAQMLSDPRFAVQDDQAAWLALDHYERADVDLSDALIAAVNRLHGSSHTVTFDAKAARIPGMTLLTRQA